MQIRFNSKSEIEKDRADKRADIRAADKPVARSRTEAFKSGQLTLFEMGLWPECHVEDNKFTRAMTLEEKRYIGMEFIDWVENGPSVFDLSEDFRKHVLKMPF